MFLHVKFFLSGLVFFIFCSAGGVLAGGGYETPAIRQVEANSASGEDFSRLPVDWTASKADRAKAAKAWDLILEANRDFPAAGRKLHVVYVSFADRPPLPACRERFGRVLRNVQAWYSDQMKANGFPPLSFALDWDDEGRLVIHEVSVDKAAAEISEQNAMQVVTDAARKVLEEKGIAMEGNHVLIVSRFQGKGFLWGGKGNSASGMAWVSDEEILDTGNLACAECDQNVSDQPLGRIASICIGGIARGLGRAFGLFPVFLPEEYLQTGVSLTSGNSDEYGQELRNEGKGVFLLPVNALQLASMPLFSGYESTVEEGRAKYRTVSFSPVRYGAVVNGLVESPSRCYAVVILLDPEGGRDDAAGATVVVPDDSGRFSMTVSRPGYNGYIGMRLAALRVDGAVTVSKQYAFVSEKGLEAEQFEVLTYYAHAINQWANRAYGLAAAEVRKVDQEFASAPIVKKMKPLWEKILSGDPPPLKEAPADISAEINQVNLVDCGYADIKVGWGVPCWDVMLPSPLGPLAFFRDGGRVERFLLVHAVGWAKYDLGGKWSRFSAQLGVPCQQFGSVRYEILGDGKPLYATKVLFNGMSERVDLDVRGVKRLEIMVKDAGDGITADWGVIGNPLLSR